MTQHSSHIADVDPRPVIGAHGVTLTTTGYDELVGRRTAHHDDNAISLGSPVGKALLGSQRGDVVQVALPNGRERSLTVLDVRVRGEPPEMAA